MPTTKTAAEKLQEAIASDPFLAGNDVHLDLSGFPNLQPLANATAEDEFAPIDKRGMGLGSADLKKFLASPDRESVAELHDADLLKRYDDAHSGTVVHASGIPFQVIERAGRWHARGKVNGQLHRFSGESKDAVYAKIMESVNQHVIKELTRTQELEIIRFCQSGRSDEGIARYLEYRIGQERSSSYDSPAQVTSDPALLDVMNECASFTWFHSRPDVQDSPEFQSFANAYLADRPAVTHALLDGAWSAFEKRQRTSALFAPVREMEKPASPREIEKGLEDLSDADIEKMMTSTKREFARQALAHGR